MKTPWKSWKLAVTLTSAATLAAVLGANLSAQQAQNQPRNAGAPAERGQQVMDQLISGCLILENENEVAAAKLAERGSKNSDVKSFAQSMEKDHQQFITDLDKFAGPHRSKGEAKHDGAAEKRDVKAAANERRPTAAATSASPHDWPNALFQIKEEVAQECRASTQRELDSRKGQEFDDCYVGMQIGAHMKMVDELKVLERHASPELASVLKKGRETAQKHLDQSKSLMKKLPTKETASK